MRMRHFLPAAEYTKIAGEPLPPARLAQIWHALPEDERLGFLHSLDEGLADELLVLTYDTRAGAQRDRTE